MSPVADTSQVRSIAEADARIDALGPRRSLAPTRLRATSLVELARAAPPVLRPAFERCLADIAIAQLQSFPDNIFWDFDALAHSLLDQAVARNGEVTLSALGQQVADLQRLFGASSTIRFRYVHDFTYGFDWSKWVRREPEVRWTHPPFGQVFIDYSLRRGHELLDLIAADDEKYPKLPDGQPRNPFGFSRDDADEIRLFEALAREDLVPVKAWEARPMGRWERDYQQARNELAKELGL